MKMDKTAACFPARTAVIILRSKKDARQWEKPDTKYTVVFPEDWTKAQLLEYVRAVHPDNTAKIFSWNESRTANDKPKLWLTNPRAFENYKKGVMK